MDFCNTSLTGPNSGNCAPVAGATILSPSMMFLAGVLGNIFALYTLYTTKTDVRTTKFYTLVAGLACTDLVGILMTSPSTLAAYLNGRKWVGGEAHCRYHGFAMTCFGLSTPMIICAMSVERFMALKCVFFYSSRCKNGTAKGVVAALWISVLWFGMLPLFGFGRFVKQYPGTWCFLDFHSDSVEYNLYGYLYASANLLLIMVMIICNGYVVVMLVHATYRRNADHYRRCSISTERNDTGSRCRLHKRKQGQIEAQMIVLMVSITTVFVVCWAPLMIQIIVTMASGKSNFLLDLAAVRLASFNQTLDPWLYILLRRSLIRKIKRTCQLVYSTCFPPKRKMEEHVFEALPQNVDDHIENGNVNNGDVKVNDDVSVNGRVRTIPSLPDVMMDTLNDQSNRLPDVTDTTPSTSNQDQNAQYVCRLEIINTQAHSDMPDEGIYVKFLFVPNSKDDSSASQSQKSSDNDSKSRVFRPTLTLSDGSASRTVQGPKSPPIAEQPAQATLSSGIFTKETSLLSSNPDTFHSEVILDNPPAADHERLRRTKSHT